MKDIRPLKKFGQNYLRDRNTLLKIVEEISPLPEDAFVEIGPGLGALTEELMKRSQRVTAVEIDTRVIDDLKRNFPSIEVINEDFLDIDLNTFYEKFQRPLRIAGNIPYNITSPIVFKLIENSDIIQDAVFMVQYEVARRMTAQKGTKDYGIFSNVLSYFTDVKFAFKVSPNVFYPRPRVDSAVVHLYFRKDKPQVSDEKLFIKVVKAAFGNRRKTLKNSLNNSIFKDVNFEGCGIDMTRRAEELDLQDFLTLTDFIYGERYGRRK